MPETYAGRRKMPPVHPGAILREDVLPALNISVTAAAGELGLSRQTLHRILSESAPVTPETALRLGRWCGNGADLWIRLQATFDLEQARQQLGDRLDAIPTHAVV